MWPNTYMYINVLYILHWKFQYAVQGVHTSGLLHTQIMADLGKTAFVIF